MDGERRLPKEPGGADPGIKAPAGVTTESREWGLGREVGSGVWGRGLSGSSSGSEGVHVAPPHPHHTRRGENLVLASALQAVSSPAPVWGPGKVKGSLQQLDSQATDHLCYSTMEEAL